MNKYFRHEYVRMLNEHSMEFLLEKYVTKYKNIIIYPFGMYGKMIKKVLNSKCNINERAIIDNKLFESYDNVYSVDYLKNIDFNDDTVIVVACQNHEDRIDILKSIERYTDNVIDIFSDEYIVDFAVRYQANGYCPCCNKNTTFYSISDWYRDYYKCFFCGSIPRQRAIMYVLTQMCPNYSGLMIHESSPDGPTFKKLKEENKNYTYSYFYENKSLGERLDNGGTNENLENMTFADASFDVFITQDVFEHVNNPDKAFSEIGRVLKPGGVHIFTVPLVRKNDKSRPRIQIDENGKLRYILLPQYHGNPISDEGSLVTWDWGYDIIGFIENSARMRTEIISFPMNGENIKMGLEAEYLEVLVSYK